MKKWVLVVLAATAAAVVLAAQSGATTGVSTGLPPPNVHVAPVIAAPYLGQYVLAEVPRSAKIRGGAIDIDYTETANPFIVGFMELDTYDNTGRASLLTANLYPFSYADGRLSAGVLQQSVQNLKIGEFELGAAVSTQVAGTLRFGSHVYPVVWKKIDDDTNLHGKYPAATLTAKVAKPKASWGHTKAFLGRYSLAADSTSTGAGASVLAPLVQLASNLAANRATPLDAQLTMIMYQATPKAPPTPAGILKIHTPTGTTVSYLTDLKSIGDERSGVLRGGNFNGPAIGHFNAVAATDSLSGTATVNGHVYSVAFSRISSDPQP